MTTTATSKSTKKTVNDADESAVRTRASVKPTDAEMHPSRRKRSPAHWRGGRMPAPIVRVSSAKPKWSCSESNRSAAACRATLGSLVSSNVRSQRQGLPVGLPALRGQVVGQLRNCVIQRSTGENWIWCRLARASGMHHERRNLDHRRITDGRDVNDVLGCHLSGELAHARPVPWTSEPSDARLLCSIKHLSRHDLLHGRLDSRRERRAKLDGGLTTQGICTAQTF